MARRKLAFIAWLTVVLLAACNAAPSLTGSLASPTSASGSTSPTTTSSLATSPSEATPSTPVASPVASSSPASLTAGFEPVSVTFVSVDQGWVLGTVPCGSVRCAAIERTGDGARTWASIPAPNSPVGSGVDLGSEASSGIARLRFATPSDGWAYGPDLWSTHDGGKSWAKVSPPGLPFGSPIVALETAHGFVQAVLYDGAQHFRVATSAIGSDAWQVSRLAVAVGAGPVPEIQLVVAGATGWLLENDRTVVGGARLVGATWRAWTPACATVTGPAAIAASSPTNVVASCDVGYWSTPAGNHLFVSSDAGATFTERGSLVPVTEGGGVATPDTATVVVAGTDASGSVLVGSFDGGQHWSVRLRAGNVGFADLGFTTRMQGVVVTSSPSGSDRLLMTRDGGHTWSAIAF
jgi:hypothetical protein